jgi:hypothetical protein
MDETLAQLDPTDPYTVKVPGEFTAEKTVTENDEGENSKTYQITVRVTTPNRHFFEIKGEKTVSEKKQ